MRISARCIRCLIDGQEEKIRAFTEEEKKAGHMKEVLRIIGGSAEEATAPQLVADIRRSYEAYFQVREDFGSRKKFFNQLVLEMEEELTERIQMAEDPLRYALTLSRACNYIDFGTVRKVDPEILKQLIADTEASMVEETVYNALLEELEQAGSLVYLLDNCGEVVVDKLVIRCLKERYPALKITAVVRGMEVLNDATMEDAVEVGLDKEVRVIGNGTEIAGTQLDSINEETRQLLDTADLIISKGQGNFETLGGCGLNVYYLFLCKCEWFAERFGVERNAGMFLRERSS